jgi:hypothetical protein
MAVVLHQPLKDEFTVHTEVFTTCKLCTGFGDDEAFLPLTYSLAFLIP